jgi:hypothetical protein
MLRHLAKLWPDWLRAGTTRRQDRAGALTLSSAPQPSLVAEDARPGPFWTGAGLTAFLQAPRPSAGVPDAALDMQTAIEATQLVLQAFAAPIAAPSQADKLEATAPPAALLAANVEAAQVLHALHATAVDPAPSIDGLLQAATALNVACTSGDQPSISRRADLTGGLHRIGTLNRPRPPAVRAKRLNPPPVSPKPGLGPRLPDVEASRLQPDSSAHRPLQPRSVRRLAA